MNNPLLGSSLLRSWISREIHISRHTLVVDGVKMNEPHCPYSANLSSDTRKPLVSKGFIPVSGAGLEPARLYKIGTSTSS